MFQFIISLNIKSVSHEGNQTFFTATHFTPNNTSFEVKGISDKALNLIAGKNYLAINAVPRNYTADGHLKHLYLEHGNMYETGSLMIESNGESVNSILMSGRTTKQSTKSSGIRASEKAWNLSKFDLICDTNIWDKTIQNKDGSTGAYPTFTLKCDYWKNFSSMPKGNEYLVQGELVSATSTDDKEYFNVKVSSIQFGRESNANAKARKAA